MKLDTKTSIDNKHPIHFRNLNIDNDIMLWDKIRIDKSNFNPSVFVWRH